MTKDDLKTAEETVRALLCGHGRLTALSQSGADDSALSEALDRLCARFESGTILLRNMREKNRVSEHASQKDAVRGNHAPRISGNAEITDYGFVHVTMNALLPNCRFGAPAYITDTVTRLLDDLERERSLPYFAEALLAIEEHADISSRRVFDQDNKAWKAVSNAFKGRLIPDDDGFTLDIAMLSVRSAASACHIYLLPRGEAGDFFYGRGEYGPPP